MNDVQDNKLIAKLYVMGTNLEDRLQELIDNDKDFAYLVEAASASTDTMWDTDVQSLALTNIIAYVNLSPEEFFAVYKDMLFFAVVVGKALNKIKVKDSDDINNMLVLRGTRPIYVGIFDKPWSVRLYIDHGRMAYSPVKVPEVFTKEQIIIRSEQMGFSGKIEFRLTAPAIVYNAKASRVEAAYQDSLMKIVLIDSYDRSKESEEFKVAEFTKNNFLKIIKDLWTS